MSPAAVDLVLAASGLPAACRPWGRGWCAAAAGILEATAPKPGNVHPAASFADLSYAELVAAAVAAGAEIELAAGRRPGATVRAAVTAARAATRSNANLGIVLAIVPIAAVPDGVPLSATAVDAVLANLVAADAADVYAAIAVAAPGGMGVRARHDVAGPPPEDLRVAMGLAADHDAIAALWARGYEPLFAGPVEDLMAAVRGGMPLLDAIVECHLRQLVRQPDSLIARKHGPETAAAVSAGAAGVLGEPQRRRPAALVAFDERLRRPLRLNPGTTADLVAAALYILLADGRLQPYLDPPLPPPS